MAQWSVEIWQPLGGVITNLPDAQAKTLTYSLTDGHTFSFSMNGRNEKAKFLRPMIADVVVWREGVKIFRGRIIQANQSGDAAGCTINVSAVDYKALLKRRVFTQTGTYTGDLETCAWTAINTTQAVRTGANLGITRGVNQATGITATKYAYELGQTVKDFIDGLAATNSAVDQADSFEWDIDPELVFKVYKPTRGKRTPTFLADFGGSVLSYDQTFDPNDYANVFMVQGNGSYSSTAITEEGRRPPAGAMFEEFVNDGQLTTPALVDSRVFWMATYNGQLELTKTYNLELSNGRWNGPRDCWLGDYVKLNIVDGVLNVQTDLMRVRDMHLSVDNAGYEAVGIAVGFSVPSLYKDINRMNAFMRSTRQDILARRANWYNITNRSLYNEYLKAAKKHGAKSYEANAAKKRWQDFYKQADSWLKAEGFKKK